MNYTLQRILAAILLVLLSPLLLLIVLLYILFYGGGCLYKVTRLGLDEKPFVLYKFRTMNEVATVMSEAEQQEWAMFGKLRHDTRLLPGIGHFLRRFSLDELPQLWNVIRGEMALIGPRPIIDAEKVMYGNYSKLIHSVKPGVTGLWQVSGRNLLTYQRRVAINVYYVRHRSLQLDLWILYRTIWAVIGGRGAY
jgi:undecaprenyl-phosphate galactose phosphotransferase